MKKHEYRPDEKLTEVRVHKVWLDRDLLPESSGFRCIFPEFWEAITEEINLEDRGFTVELKDIKKLTLSGNDMYIIYFTTERRSGSGKTIGERAFLTNREYFIDITGLMAFTNLCGCKYQRIDPTYEDFLNEFIEEVYF